MTSRRTAKRTARIVAAAIVAANASRAVSAQTADRLASASLEELMNVEVTTATRTGLLATDVPAAVYVITHDEIRRSGLTRIPELMRLVPGMQVAQVDGNKWAVAARGFNGLFSNKLLVLIDGRSVYNRSFSGVFWEDLDVVLEDVDRIEVVRGPGGAVWGANAVNAVINIVTKTAHDTKGASAEVGTGTLENSAVAARYGGAVRGVDYRVYMRRTSSEDTRAVNGGRAGDDWSMLTTGTRVDWTRGANSISAQGSYSTGGGESLWNRIVSPAPAVPHLIGEQTDSSTGHVLGRWEHKRATGSVQVQAFYANWQRLDGTIFNTETITDLDVQASKLLGARHTAVFGSEIRDVRSRFDGNFTITATPSRTDTGADSFFAQDLIRAFDHVQVVAGVKAEHDDFSGWNLQPTLRGTWEAGSHRVWAAFSRAIRTPSILERNERINVAAVPTDRLPLLISILGNPSYAPERLRLAEAGYRLEVGSAFSVDVAAFHGDYDGLTTNEPLPAVFEAEPAPAHLLVASRLDNLLFVTTSGLEVTAHWAPHPAWRLDASYSGLALTSTTDAASRDASAASFDGDAPSHQWQAHAWTRITPRLNASAGVYYTGRLRRLDTDAYTRGDAHIELRLRRDLTLVATGRNLLSREHAEFFDPESPVMPTLIPRSFVAQLRWEAK